MIDSLYLKITENCNMKCPFCYVNHKDNVIDNDIVYSALKTYNPKKVIFHGGEPLLYPKKILEIMNNYPNFEYSITSNLTLPLSKDRIKIIERCKVATSYSIDRFKEEKLENIFKNNLNIANKITSITLLVTLSEEQLKIPPENLKKTIEELNCDYILFERLYSKNNIQNLSKKTDRYLSKLMDIIPKEKNILFHRILDSLTNKTPLFSLECDKRVVTLSPNGFIGNCPNLCDCPNKQRKKRKECLCCELYQYCKGDCISFQDSCMFPKNTFLKIKEKLNYVCIS